MITALLKGIVFFTLLFVLFPAILLQGEGKLIEIKVNPAGDATEITMDGTDSLVCNDFYLDSPPRIVLDLPGTWNNLPQKDFSDLNIGGIRNIRTSQYKDDLTRVVLDVEKKMIYSVFPGKDNLRVVFRSSETGFEPWHSGSEAVIGEEVTSEAVIGEAVIGEETDDVEDEDVSRDVVRQEPEPEPPNLITVDFQGADIQAVIRAFSEFSGKSIVAGREVQGKVTAKINDLPWERAFVVLMKANGFGVEIQDGIYRVDRMENLRTEETLAMLTPTVFRLNYSSPKDLAPTIESMLSQRGKVQMDIKSNSIVVSDVPERIDLVKEVIPQLDVKTDQVTIKSKLLFVNSVDLKQLGINWMATNMMDPTTDTHGEVVTGQAVTDPFLQLTYGTFKSGTNITGMLEALEEQQLIDVQAQPQITTLDNLEAEVFVGEKTPIRVLDVGAQTSAAASVELIETGIKLVVTPHITNDKKVIMELKAERSSAVSVPTEFGVQFQTQEGRTTLLVDDGQTAVIGGLTTLDTVTTRRGVPFLSKIPLIGYLFRYSSDKVEKKDLLIFVTPYIVS